MPPVKLFIAYAREDAALLEKLRASLNLLERGGLCEIFYDGKISPGERWDDRLRDELRRADLIVLLLTQDFLNSDYVHAVELPKALERQREGTARVAPILMDDCLWEFTPLRDLQLILHENQPIAATRAFAQAARQVGRVIEEIQKGWARAAVEDEKKAAPEKKAPAPLAEITEAERKRKAAEAAQEKGKEDRRRFEEAFEKAKTEVRAGLNLVEIDAILADRGGAFLGKADRAKALQELSTAGKSFLPLLDLAESMVKIEGGAFKMGDFSASGAFGFFSKPIGEPSESPVREVAVRPFSMQATAVTVAQWCAVMGLEWPKKGQNLPKTGVSWDEAQAFIQKLNEKTTRRYRLPSEAEWEFAARERGKKCRFGTGSEMAYDFEMNFNAAAEWATDYSLIGKSRRKTVAVRTFRPNALGLFEMSGNVWEWCQDRWHETYAGAPADSRAWESGTARERVLRGGSFEDGPKHCRTTSRNFFRADGEAEIFGFRLAHD